MPLLFLMIHIFQFHFSIIETISQRSNCKLFCYLEGNAKLPKKRKEHLPLLIASVNRSIGRLCYASLPTRVLSRLKFPRVVEDLAAQMYGTPPNK